MFDVVLYRTADVDASEAEKADYYQIHTEAVSEEGREVFLLTERHGWWSAEQGCAINGVTTLSPEEGFTTVEEVKRLFLKQLEHRGREGYIHWRKVDPFKGDVTGTLDLRPFVWHFW